MIQTATLVVLAAVCGPAANSTTPSPPIEVHSLLLRLIEEVDVPAREAGVLDRVLVREGQMVERNTILAQVADTEAKIDLKRAEFEAEIALQKASNDVDIRFFKKSTQVAKAELRRATESVKTFPKSVSKSELDRLQLTVERSELEVEQAEHQFKVAKLAHQVKDNQREFASHNVQRRRVIAPVSGMIVKINRRQGEWIEPGESLLRIVRIDELRAEGFIDVAALQSDLANQPVILHLDLPGNPGAEFHGNVVFVSPLVDPVNSQIRIWAKIDNSDLKLRPGLRASMTIQTGKR